METFEEELSTLINRHSKENGSNTADFILAEYLRNSLSAFNIAVNRRDRFEGRPPASCTKDTPQPLEG